MNINSKQLFNDLNITRDNFDWDIDDYYYLREKLGIETDLNAESLLGQAEQDFETGGQGKFINSITNAKRAIQYRIDELIEHFGFDKKLRNQKKIEILTKIGFTTRIHRKVSSARNLLEHEYKLPTEQEVEEALDLAELFINMKANSMIMSDVFIFGDVKSYEHHIVFDSEAKAFYLTVNHDKTVLREEKVILATVNNNDKMYMPMLNLISAMGREWLNFKLERSYDVFFSALNDQ